MMALVHELPGTTFFNPAQRGHYDSEAMAVLIVRELQHWLVLTVARVVEQVERVPSTPQPC
jgi:putative transposase